MIPGYKVLHHLILSQRSVAGAMLGDGAAQRAVSCSRDGFWLSFFGRAQAIIDKYQDVEGLVSEHAMALSSAIHIKAQAAFYSTGAPLTDISNLTILSTIYHAEGIALATSELDGENGCAGQHNMVTYEGTSYHLKDNVWMQHTERGPEPSNPPNKVKRALVMLEDPEEAE